MGPDMQPVSDAAMALDDDKLMRAFLAETLGDGGFQRRARSDRMRTLLAQAGAGAAGQALFHRAFVYDETARDWVETQWMKDHMAAAAAEAAGGHD